MKIKNLTNKCLIIEEIYLNFPYHNNKSKLNINCSLFIYDDDQIINIKNG